MHHPSLCTALFTPTYDIADITPAIVHQTTTATTYTRITRYACSTSIFSPPCAPAEHQVTPRHVHAGSVTFWLRTYMYASMYISRACMIVYDTYIYIYTYAQLYTYSYIIEGSLEVKLPTIWTNGKAEVGRVREEKSRREKSQKKEDAGARNGKNVAKHCVYRLIWKRRAQSRLARWEMKSCT